ncbi:hypothetical protein EV127DRAFT_497347 [Xylaria flabelliformis]|nr:hypothetical protein EV127DRAFT_497347 [Xylaria flabelliformis]
MATIVTTASSQLLELNGVKEPEKRHVSTFINYYRDPGDGSPPMPVRISDKTVKNERPTIPKPTIIRDITGEEDKYTLDRNGFQLVQRATRLHDTDFHDSELVEANYYPEVKQLLKDITGASRVHIFDHKTRVGPSNWHKLGEGNRATRGPLFRAHVDQSYAGAELVLRRHFPEEADELLKRRYQIINVLPHPPRLSATLVLHLFSPHSHVDGLLITHRHHQFRTKKSIERLILSRQIWRPIKTIYKDPLAVADASSVPDSDLLAASILYPAGSRDETWTMLPNDAHQWYFKNAQEPSEALLIKCFDSATAPGLARRVPHSAFEDPDMADCGHRESIEARSLVFYDD